VRVIEAPQARLCSLLLTIGWLAACGSSGDDPTGVVDSPAQMPAAAGAGGTASPQNPPAGGSGGDSSAPMAGAPGAGAGGDPGTPDAGTPPGGCATFDGAFGAIQKVIFEGHGCTAGMCHGEAKSGGLDLRPDAAYANLVDAPSSNSSHARVQPGTAVESFLYQKLRAATEPGSVEINGSPMPVGAAPLSPGELRAIQLWIMKGAPETGSVSDPIEGVDVGTLLDACLPPAKPIPVKPLEPPAPEEGIQFILPSYVLKAGTEVENCVPFAYDLTTTVPTQYKDEARNVIFVKSSRVRQDSVSHHMVVWNPAQDLTTLAPNAPGWSCKAGPSDGTQCDPTKGSADCGEGGVCAGPMTDGTLCGGFDIFAGLPEQVANTQSPQEYIPPMDGVYWELPLRGVLWFNSHAFNLSDEDTTLNARMNFDYAQDRQRKMVPHNEIRNEVPIGQAPFTKETYCETYQVPLDQSIAMMTGHTHRRGERFWVTDPSGEMIYESFVYNDPEYTRFDPWLEYTSLDPAQRTLEFCATFNNGLKQDGSPDLDLVTRASRMPERTSCTPVACVAGKVTEPCTRDADCDSTPGAGDGSCDACPITGGLTTENEMFVLMPWLILPPGN
jgi:hypothetical protein